MYIVKTKNDKNFFFKSPKIPLQFLKSSTFYKKKDRLFVKSINMCKVKHTFFSANLCKHTLAVA